MSLLSKTFIINKGDSLLPINSFIDSEVGLDSYLIKGINATAITANVTYVTLLYSKYPDVTIKASSPASNSVLTSDVLSDESELVLLFNSPINTQALSGKLFIDDAPVPLSLIKTNTDSNNYLIKVSLSGYLTTGVHSYTIDSTLPLADNSQFPYTTIAGYSIHGSSTVSPVVPYKIDRRGETRIASIKVPRGTTPQQGISQYLGQLQINPNASLIDFSFISSNNNSLEVFFLYLSKIEPQIVDTYPANNSWLASTGLIETVSIRYNTELDFGSLFLSGIFSIESGFNYSTPIPPSNINLRSDLRTVDITVSGYLTDHNLYNIVSRPGLRSLGGLPKRKPELYSINIYDYNFGTGTSNGGSLTGSIDYTQVLGLEEAVQDIVGGFVRYEQGITGVYSDVDNTLTLSGQFSDHITTGSITGHSHFIAYSGVPPAYYQRPGMMWMDTSSARLFLWYIDPDSSQWIEI